MVHLFPLGVAVFIPAVTVVSAVALLALWRRAERGDRPERALFCPWGPVDAVLALAVFVFMLGVVGALARGVLPARTHEWVPTVVMGICGLLTAALVLVHLNRRYGLWPSDLGLKWDHWKRDLLLAAGALLAVTAVRFPLAALLDVLRRMAGEPVEYQRVIRQMLEVHSPAALAVMVVTAVLVAPLWEEIIFRGFLQPFFGRHLGASWSIVVTAALFSLIHDPGSKFLTVPVLVFPLALALGYCYHRTQRLAAPLLLHVLHNVVSVVAVLAERENWF